MTREPRNRLLMFCREGHYAQHQIHTRIDWRAKEETDAQLVRGEVRIHPMTVSPQCPHSAFSKELSSPEFSVSLLSEYDVREEGGRRDRGFLKWVVWRLGALEGEGV